jgi:hypothetical protein
MENILVEIEPFDDDSHDAALKFMRGMVELLAEFVGVPVTMTDGFGNSEEFN